MMAKLQAACKVSANSLLKFRLEEVWPSVQSNALSRPRNACNADRGFRDARVRKAAATLTKRASAVYAGASDFIEVCFGTDLSHF
jgi:hypothetical protein